MSQVTNAILTAHVGKHPDDEIASVNEFLRLNEIGGGEFKDVTDHAGGYKHLECRVYLSAFNHADSKQIVKAIEKTPWRDRETVQLFVKEQEEELFSLRYSGSETNDGMRVQLATEELRIICNALNEVCNGIDLQGEFETRIGARVEVAKGLLAKLGKM
ncbi:MAG: hypothetical protein WBE76_25695 [Terracidiphilus sp.]